MRVPAGTIALLSLAVVLYAAMMSCLADAPGGDAFGRGLALAYAAFIGAVLWVVLTALLIVAGIKGRMPVWAALGLVVLLPLSCGAVWMAGDAVGRGDTSAFWVAALLPPLFALYALRARLPALHTRSAVLGAAIVLLTAAPYVALTRAALPDRVRCPAGRARPGAGGTAGEGAAGRPRSRRGRVRKAGPGLGPRKLPGLPPHRDLWRACPGRHRPAQEPPGRCDRHAGERQAVRPVGPPRACPLAHGRPLPGVWRGPHRCGSQGSQDAVELYRRRHRSRRPACQHEVAHRQPLRPRPAARPAGRQRARRRRFLAHDRLRRHAGGTRSGQVPTAALSCR